MLQYNPGTANLRENPHAPVINRGIAMPLKYMVGMPMAVSIVGSIHGFLFVVFCFALLHALLKTPLPFRWSVIAFIASLLPFGPFLIDHRLKAFENDSTTGNSARASEH